MAKYKIYDSLGSWLGDIEAQSPEDALELAKSTLSPTADHVLERETVEAERVVR